MTLTTDINDGKPWSTMDDDDLRDEVAAGASVKDAATFLCRLPDEVIVRAAALGLRWQEPLH
jgi:hypothetical protein